MSHVDVRSGGRTPGRRGSALASVLVLALLSLVTTVGVSGGSQAEAANAPVAQLWCSGWGSDFRVSTVRADSYVDVHVHGFPPRSSVVLALDRLALPARLQTDASGSGLTSLHLSVTKFGAPSLVATAGASRAVVEITVLPPILAWDDSTASAPSVAQATQVAAPASPVPAAPKARLISPPRAPRSVSAATAPRQVASSGDPIEGAFGATDATPPSALPGAVDSDTGEQVASGAVTTQPASMTTDGRGVAGLLLALAAGLAAVAVTYRSGRLGSAWTSVESGVASAWSATLARSRGRTEATIEGRHASLDARSVSRGAVRESPDPGAKRPSSGRPSAPRHRQG